MPFEGEELGRIAPKEKFQKLELARFGTSLLILLFLFVNFKQNGQILENQKAGIIRTYISRAIVCDQAKSIGAKEPKHCDDAVIQPYRDHMIVVGSTAGARASKGTLAVMCAFLHEENPLNPMLKYCPKE